MKKLILYLFTLHTISQSCLPEGISFYSQTDIDSFPVNYPECIDILGDVLISGADITNLYGLGSLVSIGGDLLIESNNILTDLAGLENLESISGSLYIGNLYFGSYPYCNGNASLTSLAGLNALNHIGGNLEIYCNDNLSSLSGLENLVSVEGDIHIGSFETLYGFTFGNESLLNFSGLDGLGALGGNISVAANDNLINFEGMDNLVSIAGNLSIALNNSLEDLTGLDNIDAASIDNLTIRDNISLTTCEINSICQYLASPNGTIEITGNAAGCNTQEEVELACTNEVGQLDSWTVGRLAVHVYPNPSDDIFNFEFLIFNSQRVTLKIFDLYGRELATVVDRTMPPGKHAVSFNAGHLPAGVYLIKGLAIGSWQLAVGKLVVVR